MVKSKRWKVHIFQPSLSLVMCNHLVEIHTDMLRDLMRRNGSSHGGALATPGPPIGRGRDHNTLDPSIAVLVIACNRVDYIKRTLDELLKSVYACNGYIARRWGEMGRKYPDRINR